MCVKKQKQKQKTKKQQQQQKTTANELGMTIQLTRMKERHVTNSELVDYTSTHRYFGKHAENFIVSLFLAFGRSDIDL